jgi:hypothetical protein
VYYISSAPHLTIFAPAGVRYQGTDGMRTGGVPLRQGIVGKRPEQQAQGLLTAGSQPEYRVEAAVCGNGDWSRLHTLQKRKEMASEAWQPVKIETLTGVNGYYSGDLAG